MNSLIEDAEQAFPSESGFNFGGNFAFSGL